MFKTLMRAGLFAANGDPLRSERSERRDADARAGAPASRAQSQVTPVTFWAQPYPYRYVPCAAVPWCGSRRPTAGIWTAFARCWPCPPSGILTAAYTLTTVHFLALT